MTVRPGGPLHLLESEQLALIDAIYGTVIDPARWLDVTRSVSSCFGTATSIVLRTGRDTQSQRMIMTDLDPAFVQTYQDYYGALNPWAQDLFGRPLTSGLYFNDERDRVEQSEFFADWLRPLGDLRYTFSTCAAMKGSEAIVALVGTRPRALGPIDEHECKILLSILPHFERAIELSRRLGQQEAQKTALASAVQRTGAGVILVDAARHVVFMDLEAERILSSGGLIVRNGLLRAPTMLDEPLGAAIARATGGGRIVTGRTGALLTVPRPEGRLPLSVAIGPLDERDRPFGMIGPLAMVLITDPGRSRRPSEEGLRALFDLTPAEAKLVVALCAGETLASYAEATGTSLNTAKTHLKRVFDKTGETRQADLIRRVSTDMALVVGS